MCQHIHRNHLAFVESIKHKIPQAMLQEFQNDLPAYLQFLSNTVKLISLTGYQDQEHNDLLPHLLLQLRSTTIPMFQQSVLKWQREYFENTLALTLSSLISKADKECQILWHAGQWVETIDPSVAAMQALLQQTKSKSGDLLQSLAANFSSLAHRQWEITRAVRPPSRGKNPMDTPGWLLKPPRYQGQIKHFNGRDWHFCTKCGRHGRWVCTHTDQTHSHSRRYGSAPDDFRRSRSPTSHSQHPRRSSTSYDSDASSSRYKPVPSMSPPRHRGGARVPSRSRSRSPHTSGYSSEHNSPRPHVSWNLQAPPTPVPKLSILDSINMFIDEDA
jgi:hypothetical protein